MTALEPHHEPAGPEPAAPLSVAEILRREGRRAPHAASGPLRPRGHAGPPVPTLSAPRPPGNGRAVAAALTLAVAGAVLGTTTLQDALPRPGTGPEDGNPRAATGDGRAAAGASATGGAATPATALAAVSDDLRTDPPAAVTGADLAGLVGSGPAPSPATGPTGQRGAAAPSGAPPDDGPDDGARAGGPGDGASGGGPGDAASGGGPGAGAPPPDTPGGDPGSGSADVPDDRAGDPDGGGSGSARQGVTIDAPEVRTPAAVPAAPAVRPGVLRLAPDQAAVEGPQATTDAAGLGPVAVGEAALDGPGVTVSADGPAVELSGSGIETPAIDVAGTGLDLPDIATPAVGLRLG